MIELRHGRWQDALADLRQVDVVLTDSPYSARTVAGQRSNSKGGPKARIAYKAITQSQIWDLASYWAPRTRRWFVLFCDHITFTWAEAAFQARDWATFHPVPWTKTDAAPRIDGTAPSPRSETIFVARPRRRMRAPEARYRRGWYHGPSRPGRVAGVIGAKPVWLLEQVLGDYSEPGDLIVDPFAGGGSTLRAALNMGRSCIGAEVHAPTYRKAKALLDAALAQQTAGAAE